MSDAESEPADHHGMYGFLLQQLQAGNRGAFSAWNKWLREGGDLSAPMERSLQEFIDDWVRQGLILREKNSTPALLIESFRRNPNYTDVLDSMTYKPKDMGWNR